MTYESDTANKLQAVGCGLCGLAFLIPIAGIVLFVAMVLVWSLFQPH